MRGETVAALQRYDQAHCVEVAVELRGQFGIARGDDADAGAVQALGIDAGAADPFGFFIATALQEYQHIATGGLQCWSLLEQGVQLRVVLEAGAAWEQQVLGLAEALDQFEVLGLFWMPVGVLREQAGQPFRVQAKLQGAAGQCFAPVVFDVQLMGLAVGVYRGVSDRGN